MKVRLVEDAGALVQAAQMLAREQDGAICTAINLLLDMAGHKIEDAVDGYTEPVVNGLHEPCPTSNIPLTDWDWYERFLNERPLVSEGFFCAADGIEYRIAPQHVDGVGYEWEVYCALTGYTTPASPTLKWELTATNRSLMRAAQHVELTHENRVQTWKEQKVKWAKKSQG